jgi:hypothetical protein
LTSAEIIDSLWVYFRGTEVKVLEFKRHLFDLLYENSQNVDTYILNQLLECYNFEMPRSNYLAGPENVLVMIDPGGMLEIVVNYKSGKVTGLNAYPEEDSYQVFGHIPCKSYEELAVDFPENDVLKMLRCLRLENIFCGEAIKF